MFKKHKIKRGYCGIFKYFFLDIFYVFFTNLWLRQKNIETPRISMINRIKKKKIKDYFISTLPRNHEYFRYAFSQVHLY